MHGAQRDHAGVQVTYAVTWQEGDSPTKSGRLEFGPDGLALDGANGHGRLELAYAEIEDVRIARKGDERLNGRPTILVRRREGGELRIAGVVIQSGVAAELAERLAAVR